MITGIQSSSFHPQNTVTMFGAPTQKPFRVPVTFEYTIEGFPIGKLPGRYAKEYENPNAKQLYKQMQKARGLEEKRRLADELGDYRIIDLNAELGMKIGNYLEKIFGRQK